MKTFLLGAALLAAAPVVAMDCGCCMDGDFELGAHALIWQAHHCPLPTARSEPGPVGTSFEIKADYDWGFRLFGTYTQNCFFLGASYTRFESCTSQEVTNPEGTLFTTYGITGPLFALVPLNCTFASTKLRADYQNADIRLGYSFCKGCKGAMYAFANVRWVELRYHQDSHCFNDLDDPVLFSAHQTRPTTEGAGLGFGLGGYHDVWCGVGIFGEIGLTGLVATRKMPEWPGEFGEVGGETFMAMEVYPNQTTVIPAGDLKVGLNYTYECGCWAFTAELGYEMNYFWDGILDRQPPPGNLMSSNALDWARICYDLGFGGPFFGARVSF